MRSTFFSLLFILLSTLASLAQQKLAITHITVIDSTGAPARSDMTVIINHGRITHLGKSCAKRVPRDARVVDGRGKFLIPGLWDMHAHIGNDAYDQAYLKLFIANGITGIRIMSGWPEHHLWRKEIESGTRLGPRMVIGSRIIDGPESFLSNVTSVRNDTEARAAVKQAKRQGADFVKVHEKLSRESYFAIVDEAKRLGLPVEGHVPLSVSAVEASAAGQKSIEHFTGLTEAESDTNKADAIIAILKANHTWHCPTLIMRNNYAVLDDWSRTSDPRLKYVEPSWRESWLSMTSGASKLSAEEWVNRKTTVRREKVLVGRMQKAGVGILAGSDDSTPYTFPGFSLRDELGMLVDSGLTQLQALQSATLNPAVFLDRLNALGSVSEGKFADLVLLDANPLEDIHNTTRIHAVVVNGRLLGRKELDEILAKVAATMKK